MRWRAVRLPETLQTCVDRIQQRAIARVLPARTHVIRHVAEGNAGFGVAKSERTARAKVPECAAVGTKWPLGLSQLEADAETAWPPVDDIGSVVACVNASLLKIRTPSITPPFTRAA